MALQAKVMAAEDTLLRQHMVLAEVFLETRLLKLIIFRLPAGDLHLRALAALNELDRIKEWFRGAFDEASEPREVLEQWWAKVKAILEQQQLLTLAQEVGELLFPPPKT
jgi:hypothetical protein